MKVALTLIAITIASITHHQELATNLQSVIDTIKVEKPLQKPKKLLSNANVIDLDGDDIHKAEFSKRDSSIWIIADKKQDHRIFGYEKPDVNSKKMIVISIFTDDVKDNPFHCPFGAYYQTGGTDNLKLKFVSRSRYYVKVSVFKSDKLQGYAYISKKWIIF